MKTSITLALVVTSLLMIIPAVAMAQCRMGGGGPMMGGPMNFSSAPAVAPETLQKFNKETKALKAQLIDKQALLAKEWLKDDPDPDTLANIQKSIIDIHRDMQKIAKKLGIKNCCGMCPMGMGCGGAGGCGGRMGGMPGCGGMR